MSTQDIALPMVQTATPNRWQIWRSQLRTIVRLELKKNFFRWRGFWVYLLAFGPAVIIGAHSIASMYEAARGGHGHSLDKDTEIMAGIFQIFYLRLGIFFGCMGIFSRLFRGDVIEKSLHYYFLAPVRRELLALGKYLAGAVASIFFFGMGVLTSFVLMYIHYGQEGKAFVLGPGLSQLGAYLGVTALACIGYGALFLLMGLVFRNPIIPSVVILLWEGINNVLPSVLKKFSVVFYLEPLCPVEVPATGLAALFTVSADPLPTWLAVPGLLVVAALILAYACVRVRRVEISYSTD